jgi:hypothetical protein
LARCASPGIARQRSHEKGQNPGFRPSVSRQFEPDPRNHFATFGLRDLTQLSLRVGLYLDRGERDAHHIPSLRLPRASEAWFGIAVAVQRALGSTDFDE